MSSQNFISDLPLEPVGDEVLTGLSSVKGLTQATADLAMYAFLQAVGGSIRWRDSGTDPTSTVGGFLSANLPGMMYSGDLSAIKFIEVDSGATLFVSYYAPAGDSYKNWQERIA